MSGKARRTGGDRAKLAVKAPEKLADGVTTLGAYARYPRATGHRIEAPCDLAFGKLRILLRIRCACDNRMTGVRQGFSPKIFPSGGSP